MNKLFTFPENEKELREIICKIDYTSALDPNSTSLDVKEACAVVKQYGFATVCIYPTWVRLAKEHMQGCSSGILVTVGFPHGSTSIEAKTAETRQALEDGATEIDMVINIARFADGDYDYVKRDIASVVDCAKQYGVGVKVIMEIGYMDDMQKRKAAEIAVEAGAQFVKTCTGFGPGRATLHDILLLSQVVGDKVKIKASGGVASLEDQWAFIQAGASRVAGRGVILEQLKSVGMNLKAEEAAR